MKIIRTLFLRIAIILLFILAIESTVNHVFGAVPEVHPLEETIRKNTVFVLEYKAFHKGSHRATIVASSTKKSEGPATIEEAIELSKYPRHKVLATGYTAGYESTGKYPESPSFGITYS